MRVLDIPWAVSSSTPGLCPAPEKAQKLFQPTSVTCSQSHRAEMDLKSDRKIQ